MGRNVLSSEPSAPSVGRSPQKTLGSNPRARGSRRSTYTRPSSSLLIIQSIISFHIFSVHHLRNANTHPPHSHPLSTWFFDDPPLLPTLAPFFHRLPIPIHQTVHRSPFSHLSNRSVHTTISRIPELLADKPPMPAMGHSSMPPKKHPRPQLEIHVQSFIGSAGLDVDDVSVRYFQGIHRYIPIISRTRFHDDLIP